MTTLRLERTWGSDAGRLPAAFTTAVLTNDPAVAWVFARTAMRAIDTRTGETLREHALPELVCDGRRVVASCAGDDGAVLVGAVDGDGAVVHLLTLADGAMRPLLRTPWRFARLDRVAGDPRVIVDGGAIVDPRDGAWSRRNEPRWFSRDLRWCVREELGATSERGEISVRLWLSEASTGQEWELGTTTGRGLDAAFSDDGKRFWRIMSGRSGEGLTHERWTLDARRCERPSEYLQAPARHVAVRDDRDEALELHGAGYINPRPECDGAAWSARDACVSPDGRRLARVQWGVLRLTDLTTGADLSPCDAHRHAVMAATFSPCGRLAASGDHEGEVVVWSLASGDARWRFETDRGLEQLVFSPDGRTLYGAVRIMGDQPPAMTLRAWDLVEGAEITPSPQVVLAGMPSLVLSPDGARAIVAIGGNRSKGPWWFDLAAWRARPLAPALLPAWATERPAWLSPCLAEFSSDGATAWMLFRAVPGAGWERVTLDGLTGVVTSREPWDGPAPGPISWAMGHGRSALLSPGEKDFVELSVFRLDGPSQVARWRFSGALDLAVVLGPTRVVTGTYRGELQVFEGPGSTSATVPSQGYISALALSRDERRLLVGTVDGRVHLYAIGPSPER